MPEPISMFASLARSFSSFSLKSTPPPHPPQRSSFDDPGTVGLGIVAAMVTDGEGSSRSEPILIFPPANFMLKQDGDDGDHEQQKEEEKEGEEMMETDEASESYTCVTSYMGGRAVSKTVYFGLDAAAPIKTTTANNPHHHRNPVSNSGSKVDFYVSNSPLSSPKYAFPKDFLSRCYLCDKSLDGFGIFMYRDDKTFCSQECRNQYILNDGHEHLDSCGSEVLMKFSDCSQSPSSPLFSAGIAAA